MIITLVKANFSANNIGTLNSFVVLTNLSAGLTYDGPSFIENGSNLFATITVGEFFKLNPQSLMLTMGGVVVEDAFTIDNKTITINVENVSGVITIAATAKSLLDGILVNLDFTKKTLADYIADGVIYNKDNRSVLDGTYSENGLSFTNKAGSVGYALTSPIAANQDLWMEITYATNPYNSELTAKTEALYPYTMFVTGTDHEGTAHTSNCFTPAWFNNNPAVNFRNAAGRTLSSTKQSFTFDGTFHTYKVHYRAANKVWDLYVDGELVGTTTAIEYTDEEYYGYVLGAHYGYSSANNYGFTGGMTVKSLKIWQE